MAHARRFVLGCAVPLLLITLLDGCDLGSDSPEDGSASDVADGCAQETSGDVVADLPMGTADDAAFDLPPRPEDVPSDNAPDVPSDISTDLPPDVCTADCAGRECGDDGCGHPCGECAEGYGCTAQGTCDAFCGQLCDGLECGTVGAAGECVCGACDDDNPCTDDSCLEDGSCTFVANAFPCDDDDACTVGDECSEGACVPEAPVDCNDDVDCTLDGCQPESGCQSQPLDAACNDGDPCTLDSCHATEGCQHEGQPVDCVLGPWLAWSQCTEPCGGGTSTRERVIEVQAACGGSPCGPTSETSPCNTDPCPVDCTWHWGEWTECSGACPDGSRSRVTVIDQEALYGGAPCPQGEETQQTEPCSLVGVPCDDQDACTLDDLCTGDGCFGVPAVSVPMASGGCEDADPCTLDGCNAQDGQMLCTALPQPQDCQVGSWSSWSDCSSEEDGCVGERAHTREIEIQPACGGAACPPLEEVEPCDLPAGAACQDGTPCTAFETCDGLGGCDNGLPVHAVCDDDDPCTQDQCDPTAPEADDEGCAHESLQVDCAGAWSDWSPCAAICGTGTRARSFTITQEPVCGGEACPASPEVEDCAIPQGTPCDDDNPCTLQDLCGDGEGCAGADAAQIPVASGGCDDGDECTLDSCGPVPTATFGWIPVDAPEDSVQVGSVFDAEGDLPTCDATSYAASRISIDEAVEIAGLAAWVTAPQGGDAQTVFLQLYEGSAQGPAALLRCATVPIPEGWAGPLQVTVEPVALQPGHYYLAVGASGDINLGAKESWPEPDHLSVMMEAGPGEASCQACMSPDAFQAIETTTTHEYAAWLVGAELTMQCDHEDVCLGAPVINELDPDPVDGPGASFTELLNPTDSGVDLGEYALEFMDEEGLPIGALSLSQGLDTEILPPGATLVVGAQELLATLPPEVLAIPLGDLVMPPGQAGGARIVKDADGQPVDGLAWGASLPDAGEGDYAPSDPGTGTLARCPAGADSGDNWTDFDLLETPTPGAANDCAAPLPVDCIEDPEWGPWSECPQPCAGGTRNRVHPVLLKPKHGGAECLGLQDTEACNIFPCDICSIAIDKGNLFYESTQIIEGTTVGAEDDVFMPEGGCYVGGPASAVGALAGDVVYHFDYFDYYLSTQQIYLDLTLSFPQSAGLTMYLVMWWEETCQDAIANCTYAATCGDDSCYIPTLPLYNHRHYYLVVDGVEAGAASEFTLYVN